MVVLDACGCGALPDAADYGDAGTNTLAHVAEAVGGLRLPTLERLGLGNITQLRGVSPVERPAVHGRLHALGPGKDTTTGHWELMGALGPSFPTYPDGFPPDVIAVIERIGGRATICNRPVEGLRAIEEHGAEHMRSGALIVYTSQDSVLQLAAHVDVVAAEELHRICEGVRVELPSAHAVGRVIARPFEGGPRGFRRTKDRRDYALPPGPNYVDLLADAGLPVVSVGKVAQVFSHRGFSDELPGHDNETAIGSIDDLMAGMDGGLAFANLVDTDQVHGHRKDAHGFHFALQRVDSATAGWLEALGDDDMLVLCADHGCDPAHPGTDHTREYAPLLVLYGGHDGRRMDGPLASVGASVLHWLTGFDAPLPGEPFTGNVATQA